eukprot:1673859-Pyramimonas_sp.AAC.1
MRRYLQMGATALSFAHVLADGRQRVQQLAQLAPDEWGVSGDYVTNAPRDHAQISHFARAV